MIAPLRYEFPLTTQIHALKFSSARSLGRPLGLMLAEHLRRRLETAAVDAWSLYRCIATACWNTVITRRSRSLAPLRPN